MLYLILLTLGNYLLPACVWKIWNIGWDTDNG